MAAPDADYFEQMEAHLRFDLEMEVLDLAEAPTLPDGNAAPPAAPLALGPVQLSLRQELAKARRIESAASSRQVKKKSKASLQKCSSSSSELRSRRLVTMARQEAAGTKNSDGGRELEDTSDCDNRAVVALEGDSKEQNGEDIDKAASLEEKGVEDRASAGNGGEQETNHTSEAMAVPQTREEGGSEENGEEDKAAPLEENGGEGGAAPKEGGEEQETEDASEAMVVPETRGEGGSEENGENGAALLDPRDGGNGAAVEAIKDTSEAVAAPEPKEGGDDGEDEAAAREEQDAAEEVNDEGRGHSASKEIGRGGDEEIKDRSEAEPKEADVGEGKAAALEEEDGAAVKEVKEEGGEQDAAAEEVKQNGRDECNDQGTSQELVTSSVNEQKQQEQVKSKNDASSDADALKPARKRPQPRGRREVRGKGNAGNETRKAGDSVFEARTLKRTRKRPSERSVTAPTAMKKTKQQRAIAAATMDPARAGSGGIRGKRRDGEKGCRLDVQTEPELNGGLVQPSNRESGKNSRGLVENRPGLLERDVLECEEPQSNRVDLVENDIEVVLDCEEKLYDEVAADAVLPIAEDGEADEHHASGRREVSSGQRLRKEVHDLVGRPSKKSKPKRRHGSHGSKTKTDDKDKRRRQGTGVLPRDETQQIRRVRTRSAAKVELAIDPGRHEREATAAGVGSAAAETDANDKAARVHRCQSSNSSQPEAETVETVCVRGSRINRKRGVPI